MRFLPAHDQKTQSEVLIHKSPRFMLDAQI
jgi:hypothetical protein